MFGIDRQELRRKADKPSGVSAQFVCCPTASLSHSNSIPMVVSVWRQAFNRKLLTFCAIARIDLSEMS